MYDDGHALVFTYNMLRGKVCTSVGNEIGVSSFLTAAVLCPCSDWLCTRPCGNARDPNLVAQESLSFHLLQLFFISCQGHRWQEVAICCPRQIPENVVFPIVSNEFVETVRFSGDAQVDPLRERVAPPPPPEKVDFPMVFTVFDQ